MNMYLKAMIFALVGILVSVGPSYAQMTSTNYQIRWDSLSAGGSDTSSSATYILRDTLDQSAGSRAVGTNYRLDSGYRSGVFDDIITFDLLVQSASSVRAATAYAGGVITAGTDSIAVNDYVVLIQNRGASQVAGVGKVTAVGAGTITIDALATAGVDPVIDGTNDYVYELTGSSLAFGELATGSVSTGIVAFEITVDNENGYVVQVLEDGNLRVGVNTISDVADGTVTAGSEEYGGRSSDASISTSTFDTQDTALTTSGQAIATGSTAAFDDRAFLTIKIAIENGTDQGAYAHTLTYIASGTF